MIYLADGVSNSYFRFVTDGGGMAYGGLPFLIWSVWYVQCLYIYPPPLDVSAHGESFLNNGLDDIQWAPFLSELILNLG